jgi:hypothetical protein
MQDFPLEYRLQLLKDTGFEQLAAGLKCVRTPWAEINPEQEYVPMTAHKPLAGMVTDECCNMAGFMRQTLAMQPKDPSPMDGKSDHVCGALLTYCVYKQVHFCPYLAFFF